MSASRQENLREFNRRFSDRYDWRLRDNSERLGQARMNALHDVAPELYEIVSGSDADCFYQNSLVPAFDALVFGYDDPKSSMTEASN